MKIREYNLGEYRISVYKVLQKEQEQYIRSSELASVLRASKHKKYIDVLYSKIYGLEDEITKENLEGRILESLGIDLLPYYEENTITTYRNKIENKPVRSVFREENTFKLVISDYIDDITIMVSPDAYIYNFGENLIPVDIKRMNTWSFQSYKSSGLMNSYVWQSLCQMLAYESETGHLFIMEMKDNGIELHLDTIELQSMIPYLPTIVKECKIFYDKLKYYKDRSPEELLKEEGDILQVSDKVLNKILESVNERKDSVITMEDERIKRIIKNMGSEENETDIEHLIMKYMEDKNTIKNFEEYFERFKKSFQMSFPEHNSISIDSGQDYLIRVSLKPFRISIKNK